MTNKESSISLRAVAVKVGAPVLILMVSLAGFFALGKQPAPPQVADDGPDAALVETVPVQRLDGDMELELDGLVSVYREVPLSAQVSGLVSERDESCKAGKFVAKDTLLFQIEKDNYQFEVDRLESEWQQAQVSLQEHDVEVANTQASLKLAGEEVALRAGELARAKRLGNSGVSTTADLENAQRNELQARTSQQTLQNQLASLNARRQRLVHAEALTLAKLQRARKDLKRTTIRAPFDAMIVNDPVEEGSMVQMGTQLVLLEKVGTVEVRSSLRMEELDWLRRQKRTGSPGDPQSQRQSFEIPPTPAEVSYSLGGREFVWDAELQRFDGWGLNDRTRTVPVRVLIKQPRTFKVVPRDGGEAMPADANDLRSGPALMRGLYVNVRLKLDPEFPLLKLPEAAVRPGGRAWCLRDGKLQICEIRVMRVVDGFALIDPENSDLKPNDQVIVSPLAVVTDGMPVRTAEEKPEKEKKQEPKPPADQLDDENMVTWKVVPSAVGRASGRGRFHGAAMNSSFVTEVTSACPLSLWERVRERAIAKRTCEYRVVCRVPALQSSLCIPPVETIPLTLTLSPGRGDSRVADFDACRNQRQMLVGPLPDLLPGGIGLYTDFYLWRMGSTGCLQPVSQSDGKLPPTQNAEISRQFTTDRASCGCATLVASNRGYPKPSITQPSDLCRHQCPGGEGTRTGNLPQDCDVCSTEVTV